MTILCYHCCHACSKLPLQLPWKYNSNNDSFLVEGFFCSWECMKTWNSESNDSLKNIRFNLIQQMYQKQFSKKGDIKFAPTKKNLKCFGGDLSHEEFKNKHNNIKEFKFPVIQTPSITDSNVKITKTKSKPSFLETSMGIVKS